MRIVAILGNGLERQVPLCAAHFAEACILFPELRRLEQLSRNTMEHHS
jgi:hypothetical protein